MALTKSFQETVIARVQRDPRFANAMFDEAATLFLNGEPETARLVLRDLVNATIGFEALGAETGVPVKSLHRMLAARGNPSMNHLAGILACVGKHMNVQLEARSRKLA